jgi:hypothetical protein
MTFRRLIAIALTAGTIAAGSIPLVAQQRAATGPIARYDMRAGTTTGFGGGMGGGNPMAAMMGGGGGGNVQHELLLRLGSSVAPTGGAPKADHFMPPNARLGRSVALTTPREERIPDQLPQKPRGRMLLFWGCGEHAPAGQPVVIDFARLAAGQAPPGLWTSTVTRDWGPTLENSRTFGHWPSEDGKTVRSDSSLIGAHRVAGNYSPEISFQLTKDFMAALHVRVSPQASGATLATWSGIPDATGYLLFTTGARMGPNNQPQDMVMWTSSATRQFGGGLADWLTPAQVAPLVRDRTILPPTATSCTVPAEVKRAAPDFLMGTLTAFGPMEDFAYPPRPANPRLAWNPQWVARIRHRSTSSWMEAQGMIMGSGMDGDAMEQAQRQQRQQEPPPCRPRRGLGGIMGGVLGAPGC